jgi:peptidoglycan/LPS O-acetylase OafA/YrhL
MAFLFPIFVLYLRKRANTRQIVLFFVSLVALGIAFRWYAWSFNVAHLSDQPITGDLLAINEKRREFMTSIYYPTWTRLDGLLAGVAMALIELKRSDLWNKVTQSPNLLAGIGFSMLVSCMIAFKMTAPDGDTTPVAILGYPLVALSWALIVAAASCRNGILGNLRFLPITLIAQWSYSIYLSHKIVFHLISVYRGQWLLSQNQFLALACYMIPTFLGGAVLYYSVERVGLKFRERYLLKSA